MLPLSSWVFHLRCPRRPTPPGLFLLWTEGIVRVFGYFCVPPGRPSMVEPLGPPRPSVAIPIGHYKFFTIQKCAYERTGRGGFPKPPRLFLSWHHHEVGKRGCRIAVREMRRWQRGGDSRR